MSLRSWLLGEANGFDKADEAISLADELTAQMRERTASPDPIRALLADMYLQRHDVALVADAFEAAQESRIFHGPPK